MLLEQLLHLMTTQFRRAPVAVLDQMLFDVAVVVVLIGGRCVEQVIVVAHRRLVSVGHVGGFRFIVVVVAVARVLRVTSRFSDGVGYAEGCVRLAVFNCVHRIDTVTIQ